MIFDINKARKITYDYQKCEAKQIDQDADKLAKTLLNSPSFVNDAANAIEERINSNIHDMASIGKSYCDYCDGFVQDKIIYSENMIKVLDAENDVLLKYIDLASKKAQVKQGDFTYKICFVYLHKIVGLSDQLFKILNKYLSRRVRTDLRIAGYNVKVDEGRIYW